MDWLFILEDRAIELGRPMIPFCPSGRSGMRLGSDNGMYVTLGGEDCAHSYPKAEKSMSPWEKPVLVYCTPLIFARLRPLAL